MEARVELVNDEHPPMPQSVNSRSSGCEPGESALTLGAKP